VVHSQKKEIEIEAELFHNPSPLMLSYLHKFKFFNYTIQLVIMKISNKEEKKETGIEKHVGSITADVLVQKFADVQKKIPELDKITKELKVTSPETLVIGTNNLVTVNNYIKDVDATRKILKQPSLDESKMIDNYCKTIDDMLKRFKERLTSEVTNYKTIQEAAERQEQQKRLREIEDLEKEKTEESELLIRIDKQLNARLYGGVYYTKLGERKSSAGCIKSSDCADLHKVLNDKIPPVTAFKHFHDRYEEMIRKIAKRISEHEANLMDVEGVADNARKLALERIAQARSEAEVELLDNGESIKRQISKEIRKEEIITEKKVIEAGKGVRSVLKFKIIDESKVTRDFYSIDENKIKTYLNEYREQIKKDLQENVESLPGIRFYMEELYVAR
jgi:hypothetical protein